MKFLYRGAAARLENLWAGPYVSPRQRRRPQGRSARQYGITAMLDIVMLVIGLGFFALSVGYAHLSDRL